MKRFIYAASNGASNKLNKIGKYLKSNLDGAYKIAFHPNECEVFMKMLYELEGVKDSLNEMKFIISLVSYQNKIRINITEDTAQEKTIGQLILSPDEVEHLDLYSLKLRVMNLINKSINKEYEDFIVVY